MRKYGPKGKRRSGRVLLVHNDIRHTADMPSGLFGFRIWYDFLDAPQRPTKYTVCKCGWRPDLGTHYRVKSPGSPNYRVEAGTVKEYTERIEAHRVSGPR